MSYPISALRKSFLITILLLLMTSAGMIGGELNLPFTEGDRVCFVGDSITHGGGYHHDVRLYHLTRFPSVKVTFFNCGIGGDTAESVLRRMEDDVLNKNPDRAMLMLGMNDVYRHYYAPDIEVDERVLKGREEAISKYENNMEELVSIFCSKNVELVLQTPSVYDELTVLETPANVGVNQALKQCMTITKELGRSNQLPVVDYWTAMDQILVELNKHSPCETIIGNDRVHPGKVGHFIMSYLFLKAANAPKYVSELVIGKNTCEANNCEVDEVSWEKDSLSFSCKESALPYPLIEEEKGALEFVSFNKDFNVELLQVPGLGDGQYSLNIDDQRIGSFSSEQLGQGINLALYENTPQYQQAMEVRNLLEALWEKEVQLRDIKFVESRNQYSSCPDKDDLEKLEEYYLKQFKDSKYAKYHRYVIGEYVKHKPNEDCIRKSMDELQMKAFEQAKPTAHRYQILKLHLN